MSAQRIDTLLSLAKSIYVNIRLLGIKGLHCPILVKYNVKVKNLKRDAVQLQTYSFGIISIGFGGIPSIISRKSIVDFGKGGGKTIFHGSAQFSEGIVLKNKGTLIFGDGFSSNKNCTISCTEKISLGQDCLLGWNIHIRDSDGHAIIENGERKPTIKAVDIGNHVWIASECHILKGASIPDGCVIGYKSLVNKSFDETHCIIAGHPAQIVKRNIDWEK